MGEQLLSESSPERLIEIALRIADETTRDIESSLPRALAGDQDQVRRYAFAYRRLTERLLTAAGYPTEAWIRPLLEREAMSAPFTIWVGEFGVGTGTVLAAVVSMRHTLPGTRPEIREDFNRRFHPWNVDELEVVRFFRGVESALSLHDDPLDRIADIMDLDQTELAALFGVSRQALSQWRTRGVPADRQEKLATVGAIADLLEAKIKRERIPGIVRRPAAANEGRSMLDAISMGEEAHVASELRDAFDWAKSA